MPRLFSLITGAILGAVLVLGAQKYHVVRATDGIHLVPKTESGFAETYVDVRSFGIKEWASHKSLAAAVIKAKKESLFGGNAADTLKDGLHEAVDNLLGAQPNTWR